MRRSLPRALAAAATSLAAATAFLTPAHAVTDGNLDGDAHPMVGLMVAQDETGSPLWRCTGSLISPTQFITAGHCTSNDRGGSVAHVEIWFDSGPITTASEFLDALDADDTTPCTFDTDGDGDEDQVQGYPCQGDVGGTAHTHPDYDPAEFWKRDIGAVTLERRWTVARYASLPRVGTYDGWKSKRKQRFTSVGYGLQEAYGQGASWKDKAEKVRMASNPRLISVNTPYTGDYNMILSNNAKTGGTCFGDSGGPNFVGTSLVIAGVTSFGKNPTCAGQGGIYRLDRQEDVPWLQSIGFR